MAPPCMRVQYMSSCSSSLPPTSHLNDVVPKFSAAELLGHLPHVELESCFCKVSYDILPACTAVLTLCAEKPHIDFSAGGSITCLELSPGFPAQIAALPGLVL